MCVCVCVCARARASVCDSVSMCVRACVCLAAVVVCEEYNIMTVSLSFEV